MDIKEQLAKAMEDWKRRREDDSPVIRVNPKRRRAYVVRTMEGSGRWEDEDD
jgi:hypothetical protein